MQEKVIAFSWLFQNFLQWNPSITISFPSDPEDLWKAFYGDMTEQYKLEFCFLSVRCSNLSQ